MAIKRAREEGREHNIDTNVDIDDDNKGKKGAKGKGKPKGRMIKPKSLDFMSIDTDNDVPIAGMDDDELESVIGSNNMHRTTGRSKDTKAQLIETRNGQMDRLCDGLQNLVQAAKQPEAPPVAPAPPPCQKEYRFCVG